jgi:hypothetical protein
MGGMVGGFRRAVRGRSDKRPRSAVDTAITVVLVLAAVAILVWRFGGG